MPISATVSLINQPYEFSPVNGELWYITQNSTSGLTDFNYLFNVYTLNFNTLTVKDNLGLYRVPERPSDGYGYFSPSRIIKSVLSYDLQPAIGVIVSPLNQPIAFTNSIVPYYVTYGFEYDPGLTFSGVFNSSGFVGLSFSSNPGLKVGDIININKDNKNVNYQYDGTASVTNVLGTFSVRLNEVYVTSSFIETGTIDGIVRWSGTGSNRWAFNGTKQYNQNYYTDDCLFRQGFDFGSYYVLGNSGYIRVLSNYYEQSNPNYGNTPVQKTVNSGNYETVSFLNDQSYGTMSYKVIKYSGTNTNSRTIIGSASFPGYTSTDRYGMWSIGVGPKNIQNLGFSLANADSYIVQLLKGTSVKTYVDRVIDKNCYIYNNVRIAFLNKFGVLEYWNFQLDSKNIMNTDRYNYKRTLDWNYDVGQRGDTILTQNAYDTYVVNTNFINEYDYNYLKELISTGEAYVIDESVEGLYVKPGNVLFDWGGCETDGGGYDVLKYPIIITDTSYEVKTSYRDKIFNLTLNYKMAYNITTQNK
jgi:hypothetical protein